MYSLSSLRSLFGIWALDIDITAETADEIWYFGVPGFWVILLAEGSEDAIDASGEDEDCLTNG